MRLLDLKGDPGAFLGHVGRGQPPCRLVHAGIAALPRYVAHRSLTEGALTSVLDDWALPSQEVHAVFPSPRMVPAKVRLLITWLQSQFGPDWWARPND